MSKFTFIKQPEDDNWLEEGDSKLTTEFSAVTLDRVLEEFELFLKGSGFVFNGHLDFVQDKSSFDDDLDDIEEGTRFPGLGYGVYPKVKENISPKTNKDDLDDIEQWFGKAKETAKKSDDVWPQADNWLNKDKSYQDTIENNKAVEEGVKQAKENDVPKTPDPWPFTNGSDIKIEIVDSPRDE